MRWQVSGDSATSDARLQQSADNNPVLRPLKCNLFDPDRADGAHTPAANGFGVFMSPARDFLRAAVILGVVVFAVAWAFQA